MLKDAGWEADTHELTHAKGARPERNRNLAIAEWLPLASRAPTTWLFAGLTPVAAVEAKRLNVNVAGKIGQAERYARGLQDPSPSTKPPGWLKAVRAHVVEPRPGERVSSALRLLVQRPPAGQQSPEASGTWFRDLRHQGNLAKPLQELPLT